MFKRVLVAMATLLAIMATAISPASAETAATRSASGAGWIHIVNGNSGQCLAIGGGNAYPGATAIQWTCNGRAEQTWYVDGHAWSPIYYNSELCIAIGGGSLVRGAKAILWPCNGGREQLWYVGPDVAEIYNNNSGLCLAISGASLTRGAPAIQWTCNGGREQDWWFYN